MVSKWLRQAGADPSKRKGFNGLRKDCPVTKEVLRRMYEEDGHTSKTLAKHFNVSTPTVLRWLQLAGVDTRRKIKGVTVSNGYRQVVVYPDWPFYGQMGQNKGGNPNYSMYVLEHRKVMADHLGRALRDNETVHHINGNRLDNRIENLQLRNGHHGNGVRLVCRSCGCDDLIEAPLG
jgi:hypothetical protein